MTDLFINYSQRLQAVLKQADWSGVSTLAQALLDAWKEERQVFLCGNGGSAGNAIHLANDLLYGVSATTGVGMKVEALSANAAVLTCLANDLSYADIYSHQLKVKARSGDVVIVLSGSGNSPNVVNALETGNEIGMKTFAILGYSGGKCKQLAQTALHFAVDDMQISEDLQLVVGHMCMQWLRAESLSMQRV